MTLMLKDDQDIIDRYRRYHRDAWPEVIVRLREVGIVEMRIYLVGRRLFMYMEAVDGFAPERDFPKLAEAAPYREWDELIDGHQELHGHPRSWPPARAFRAPPRGRTPRRKGLPPARSRARRDAPVGRPYQWVRRARVSRLQRLCPAGRTIPRSDRGHVWQRAAERHPAAPALAPAPLSAVSPLLHDGHRRSHGDRAREHSCGDTSARRPRRRGRDAPSHQSVNGAIGGSAAQVGKPPDLASPSPRST